ncbi:hypothetical protein [Rhizorhabdus dicambivorans]|uniref:General secretion pathway protein GspM n=1 Tax=Rhizorhabdus dicambivorans TaxID=1850238 RepID=A0A2A4FTA4_9SPHN|nr:hypothetical protein [Rhizorhabdus dicambivorans]ATE63528.1 hypothetical protein CMV14_03160 [Rhizorhabdus dicambivorans]PCE41417.1 hypothetical protein COO09_15220 [Rhizorhabdus dicambivorans]
MIALLDRRWAKPALAVGLAVAVLLAWTGLEALGSARGDLAVTAARARAGGAAPRALLPDGLAQTGDASALAAKLRGAALARRLLVERIAAVGPSVDAPAELAVDLSVSGPESDVLAFARAIETGRPAVRFSRWRLARTGRGETAIRLDARAVGYGEPR